MLNIEPLPIALDHELTVDMDHLFNKCLFGDDDTPVVLHVTERSALIVNKTLANIPPAEVKTYFLGNHTLSSYWFRLSITCGELYEKLVCENDPESVRKLYVDVVLGKDGYHVLIQTERTAIHEEKCKGILDD